MNFYCTVFVIILIPLDMIPYFGSGISWNGLWENQYAALCCFFGSTSLPDPTGNCASSYAGLWVFLYGFTGLMMLWMDALVVQYDSALFTTIVDSAVTPISSIVFSFSILPGLLPVPMTWYTWLATVMVTFGILLYKGQDVVDTVKPWLQRLMVRKGHAEPLLSDETLEK